MTLQTPVSDRKWVEELRFATVAFLCLFLVVVVRNAWVSEDAHITFRTVDNWLGGYGLRWNVAERVQTYTHPLWLFLLASGNAIVADSFFVSMSLSILLSLTTAVIVAFRVARSDLVGLCALSVLISSKAFVDYTTSGLENPLTHFLLALFFWVYFRRGVDERTIFRLSFIAALSALNRLDSILFYLPALAHVFMQRRTRKDLPALLLGFSPLFLWECFSLVYYGFLFPNTAYAKLNTGIPQGELLHQGGLYFLDFLQRDPLGLITVALSLLVARRRRDLWAPALGLILSLLYILSIGGDYMTGRFFAAPVLVAVLILSQLATSSLPWGAGIVLASLALGLLSTVPPLTTGVEANDQTIAPSGIADERSMSYQQASLLRTPRHGQWPNNGYVDEGRRDKESAKKSGKILVVQRKNVGYYARTAGPAIHVVDELALGDPLIARLPAIENKGWRIGHFQRKVPDGYLKTLREGGNHFTDKNLGEYYKALRVITRAPILNWHRLRLVWKFNLGRYDHLIDSEGESKPDSPIRSSAPSSPAVHKEHLRGVRGQAQPG